MYAIVNIQGFQFKVSEGQELIVNRLSEETGNSIELKDVLLLDNDGAVQVGKPFVEGVSVKATVVDHLKDDKVLVFKKKRRKGYQVKNGHRQAISVIKIDSINS